MRRLGIILQVLAIALTVGLVVTGCSSDDDDASVSPNLNGIWAVTDSNGDSGTFNIAQNGSTLTGSITTSDGTSVPLTGTLNGNAFTMTGTAGPLTINFTGTVTGNAMSGTASDSTGDTVTFTAVKL
ncbi:MAG: hypothetical protein HN919_18320 [Verrucomicrobia bacterium]|jgi:hypothetical protein|nr:hypothetical protein [Verrucomicrobiota bacterium]MBT7068258.1 hypothetical protein [Verrucomicrobiota bacterium]MBT7699224.1 hypothetical protein [Verrucomicrobiota bacterium]